MYQNRFGRGSAMDSFGGAYDAPPDPIIGNRWEPLPFPFLPRLWRLYNWPRQRAGLGPQRALRRPCANHCVVLAAAWCYVKVKKYR